MTICRTCGKQLSEGVKFCIGCGASASAAHEHNSDTEPMQQRLTAAMPQSSKRARFARSFATVLTALLIASLLPGWVTIRAEIDSGAKDILIGHADAILTEWFAEQVARLDFENLIFEVRYDEGINNRLDEFIDEIVESISQDLGLQIQMGANFEMADLLTDDVIYELIVEIDGIVRESIAESIAGILSEIRSIFDEIPDLSLSVTYAAHGLTDLTQTLALLGVAVQAAIPESSEFAGLIQYIETATLAANILRAIWAVCLLHLFLFMLFLSGEFKIAGIVGQIGAGFAFVFALVFAIGLHVGGQVVAGMAGPYLQLAASLWVYICLGLSLATLAFVSLSKKPISGI